MKNNAKHDAKSAGKTESMLQNIKVGTKTPRLRLLHRLFSFSCREKRPHAIATHHSFILTQSAQSIHR